MATGTTLALRVAARCHDASQTELSAASYLAFLNDAIDDLVAAGWLQPQTDDVSLTVADGTYNYNVPSGFAYIREIFVADSAGEYPAENRIPQHQWDIRLNGSSDPEIYFYPDVADLLANGRALRIVGQKRPSQSISGSDTIVAGMEAFIRERATFYALQFLQDGVSSLSQSRAQRAQSLWAISQQMLGYHPQEFRVKPNSRYVFGR